MSVYDPSKPGGSVHAGTFETVDAAVRAKQAFEKAKRARKLGARDYTCDEFSAIWCVIDYLRPEETSNVHYRTMVKPFGRDFAGVKMRDVSPEVARLWVCGGVVRPELEWIAQQWRDRNGEPLRRQRGRLVAVPHAAHGRAVRTMFNDARRDGYLDTNPFADLRAPRSQGRKHVTPLTRAEVDAMLAKADEFYPDTPAIAAFIATAAYTGMRLGELFELRWDDLDFKRGRVRVERQWRGKASEEHRVSAPKHGSSRTIALPAPAVEWLRRVPRHVDGYVFHSQTGIQLTGRVHHYYWDPVRKAIGKPRLAFHELRHFCGSYLAEKGVRARDIAHQLGHRDGGRLADELYIHTYEDNATERILASFED